MVVRIRLWQQGKTHKKSFRLVAADSSSAGSGKYLEKLGYSLPYLKDGHADKQAIDKEAIVRLIGVGAQMTDGAYQLIRATDPEFYRELAANAEARKVKKAAKKRLQRKKRKENKLKAASGKEASTAAPKAAAKKTATPKPVAEKTAKVKKEKA